MKRLPLTFLLLASGTFGQGTVPALNTWTQTNTNGNCTAQTNCGYGTGPGTVAPFGYGVVGQSDKADWIASRNLLTDWMEYRTAFSENNDALFGYNYPTNRWTLLGQTAGAHSTHRPGTGHQWGYQAYVPSIDSFLWSASSGANTPDVFFRTWQWDVSGMVASAMPDMTYGGNSIGLWLTGAVTASGYESWDVANGVMVAYPNSLGVTGEALVCNPTNSTSPSGQAAQTCTVSPTGGTNPPQELGSGVNDLRYDDDDGYTYWKASATGYLYRFCAGSQKCGGLGNWQLMNSASCSGADCVGASPGYPPLRQNASMAYSKTDHVWLMVGGFSGATTYTDTWKFDPAANAGNGQWTELCSACGYPGVTQAALKDGDRLVFDATDNIFEFLAGGFNVWVYAISTPLGFGRAAASYAPPQPTHSRNRNAPPSSPGASVAQTGAIDLSIAASGSAAFYLAHSEPSLPADSNCTHLVPYFWASTSGGTWLPSGTADTACASVGLQSSIRPSGHPFIATVNGTIWEVDDERNFGGSSSQMQTAARCWSTTCPSGGTVNVWTGGVTGCFSAACYSGSNSEPTQYPQGLVAGGASLSAPTMAVIELSSSFNNQSKVFVAQYNGSSWTSVTGSTALNAGGSLVNYAALAADAGGNVGTCWTASVETRTTLTTTPQVWAALWNGTSMSSLGSTYLNQSGTGWAADCSIANVLGVWYVAWTERTLTGNQQLYVKAYNPGTNSWSLVGSGSLNVSGAAGIAHHPRLTTDGVSLFLAWEEQSALGQHALGYVMRLDGTIYAPFWSRVGTAIAADPTNGSIADIGIAVPGGAPTIGETEVTFGNLSQVYAFQWATSGGVSSWTIQ